MWSFSNLFSSHTLCFLCFCSVIIVAAPDDIISKTCKKCADDHSPIFDFNLCETSLQAVPVSHSTNLQGLGIIAMELALENATSTIERIDTLLMNSTGTFDLYTLACLKDCSELYSDAAKTLVLSIGAFMSGDYHIAGMWVGAVMEVASTCEESFRSKGGEASPLFVENHYLFQLSDIALCITQRLGVPAYIFK